MVLAIICLSNFESHFKSMMHLTAVEREEQEQVQKLRGNYKQKEILFKAMH